MERIRNANGFAVALVVVLALIASVAGGTALAGGDHSDLAKATGIAFITPVHHVFVIAMENQPLSAVLSQGYYEAALANSYVQSTEAYSECHNSTPNYLSIITGNSLACGQNDNLSWYDGNHTTLVGAIAAAGGTWDAYMEEEQTACQRTNYHNYVFRHNPFAEIWSVAKNTTDPCSNHEYPFTGSNGLWAMVNSSSWPNFAFISPGLYNDGHDDGVAGGNEWLQNFIPYLQEKSQWSSTAVIIYYDESWHSDRSSFGGLQGTAASADCSTNSWTPSNNNTCGGQVYMQPVSEWSHNPMGSNSDAQVTTEITSYNIASTIEWMFDLPAVGTYSSPTTTASFGPVECWFEFGLSDTHCNLAKF